ncbi:DUF983 domain-containing protein [Altererythrobacter sp. KTW20L]|uniref:DUF983 domain-containing protein n=1 Tax=Altererythrobacter sp. KTW20L TaxID=2942210 RepID=UPI0020BF0C63|nr:DUF983 domain-containing protein [Altererythrobacter sp. KTW20L]MCL6250661.1 DUF983 domain-containing protein [Altererythrobacter sp. KTW20L]
MLWRALLTDHSNTSKGQPGLAEAALFGLCPRCGGKTLFADVAKFSDRCGACGLDYSRFNVGDGPAAFLTLGVGALVVGLALWVELALAPPFWVHIVLWLPLIVILVVASLRFTKGALLVREFQSRAEEHRHDGSDLS